MILFTDLPADVLHQILVRLPDFHSLAATIKVFKYFNAVFQDHRKTILTSVALNLVGDSLPYALRLALWLDQPDGKFVLRFDESIEAATASLATLSRAQRRLIEANALAIEKLEDMFSQMFKDRRSKTSVLTGHESLRLRNALYRVWLFCLSVVEKPDEPDFTFALGWPWNEVWDALVARLVKYDTQDLLDVVAVVWFLRELLGRCMTGDTDNSYIVDARSPTFPGIVINPGKLYEWTKKPSLWKTGGGQCALPVDMFDTALRKVCSEKNMRPESILLNNTRDFIKKAYGENDQCFRCHMAHGMNLYGRPNWHFLGGIIGIRPIRRDLPGMLRRNDIETIALSTFLYKEGNFDWGTFTEEIFDVEMPVRDGAVWDKEQWYCTACITKLFTTRFPYWYIARPKREYEKVKKDCCDGWNCSAQLNVKAHANEFNHFCKPAPQSIDYTKDLRKILDHWSQFEDSE